MPSLEPVVRPFQSPGVINDKKVRVTRVIKIATERAIITWGSAGSSPETKQVGIKVTVKGTDVKKPFKEKSRKTTDVDVTNPDDASQKVTVRRIDEIQFERPKPFSDNVSGQPTDVPPGNQSNSSSTTTSSTSSTTSGTKSSFNDGSSGTTISKTDGTGGTTTFVDDNTNVVATSNAGTVVSSPEKRTETDTFTLKWDDTGAGA